MKFNRFSRNKDRHAVARRKAQQPLQSAMCHLSFESLENRRLLALDLQLFKDIYSGDKGNSSSPSPFVQVGSFAYFSADSDLIGRQLWKTNGTAAGTTLVKDFGSSFANPEQLVNVNGTLFFTARDNDKGRELWKSNGTAAGTVRVKDIRIGELDSNPTQLTNVNGILFFTADDGDSGTELWKSNGTAAGTVLVRDIRTGVTSTAPTSLTSVGSTLYFVANDGTSGVELWKSNGTTAGTVLVKDVNPTVFSSDPRNLTNVGGTLFFSAVESHANGRELWKSNGTVAGTVLVKEIAAGSDSSNPTFLTNVNGTLFFRANDDINGNEIWKSNGSANGTVLVRDLESNPFAQGPRELATSNGLLYFTKLNASNETELWKSNGTSAGTVLMRAFATNSYYLLPSNFVDVNGVLFFKAFGDQIWKSNGTTAGTVVVKDLLPDSDTVPRLHLSNVNGSLFFNGFDRARGSEVWKSNGTAAGTVLVKDVHVVDGGSDPEEFTRAGNFLYFSATDPEHGTELWRTDGTPTGTILVKDLRQGIKGSFPAQLTNVNGTLFFIASDDSGNHLWKSDGSTVGTVLVKSFSSTYDLTNFNGTLFFAANDGVSGMELWTSNGTTAGTRLFKDIETGSGGSRPVHFIMHDRSLYFVLNRDSYEGSELWKTNGTPAGTVLVRRASENGVPLRFDELVSANGSLIFESYPHTLTRLSTSLWKSDGTTAGTVKLKTLPGNGIIIWDSVEVSGIAYYWAREHSDPNNDNTDVGQLWKSDGTSTGTVLVKEIGPTTGNDIFDADLTNVNGTLFFAFESRSSNTVELWKSNGTAAGTVVVRNFDVATSGHFTSDLTNINGRLFFRASDGVHGDEVWQSDGTSAGTVMAEDFLPGPLGSRPEFFTEFDGKLFLAAKTPDKGRELVFADLGSGSTGTSLAIAATSANKIEGNSGTTSFTFTVTRSGSLTGATTVNYAVTGAGASPATANDFVGNAFPSGTVTFAAGQATRVITIPVRGDTTVESNETFRVTLSSASGGATITTATANGIIRNDDTTLAMAPTSANKNEGNSGSIPFTFTVTRTGFTAGSTTVNYAVTGIGASPATANDFVGNAFPSGTVTFAAGQVTRVITIPVRGDTTVESNEAIRVTLSGASGGATITTAAANGVIRNDDTSLAIAPTSANKNEGNSGAIDFTFTVTRSGLLTRTTTVDYAVTGIGTNPASANDFIGNVLPTGTVNFAPGETTKVISIPVRGDVTVEANEGFRVRSLNPSLGASITTAIASGLIRNDDV